MSNSRLGEDCKEFLKFLLMKNLLMDTAEETDSADEESADGYC
jgi:hypothetical protein